MTLWSLCGLPACFCNRNYYLVAKLFSLFCAFCVFTFNPYYCSCSCVRNKLVCLLALQTIFGRSRFNACIHYFSLWLLCINISVKKLSRASGILAKVKPFLSTKALLTSIVPYFTHGFASWNSTYKIYSNNLSTLQNKAVKIIGTGKYCNRATPTWHS